MPRKPTPTGKQRVRTGCLTCRKRRRKCDEQKPRCANCEVKGFACKYGTDLAFVPPRSGLVCDGARQAYSRITFVDDTPRALNPARNKHKTQDQPRAAQEVHSDDQPTQEVQSRGGAPEARPAIELHDLPTSDEPTEDSHAPLRLQSASNVLSSLRGRRTPERQHSNSLPGLIFKGSCSGDRLPILKSATAGGNHETDLLRHFRYRVAPWIDVDDPDCAFGVQVLLLSRTNRSVQAAILALSATQRSIVSPGENYLDKQQEHAYRKDAENSLVMDPELVRNVGHALLMLQDLLPSGPEHWRTFLLRQRDVVGSFPSPAALGEQLGEGLFWLLFRIDLASCIINSQSPILPFRSCIRRDGSPIHSLSPPTQPQSVNRVYKHALCLLAHCLSLIHESPAHLSPQTTDSPELAAFPALGQSHFLSQWTFLWTDSQKWYHDRPVDVQQIVDVRGGEADQIEPDHDSSFPILIYTTPLALAANAVYHITSLLLLTHKPRLLKSLPGPRCFTSHIWHAQSIAGIAASNDSSAQWDPILIASLLAIAREMTHESQQTVILERLRRIATTTGIKLDREIDTLRSDWDMARYDDDAEEHETEQSFVS